MELQKEYGSNCGGNLIRFRDIQIGKIPVLFKTIVGNVLE